MINKIDQYVTMDDRTFENLEKGLSPAGFHEILEDYTESPDEDPESWVFAQIMYDSMNVSYFVHIHKYKRLYTCADFNELMELMQQFKAFLKEKLETRSQKSTERVEAV